MITSIAENIAAFFVSKGIIPKQKQDVLRYGFELIISTLVGILVILAAGAITGKFWYSVLFMAVFIPLRQYTGGYHADTYLQCNIKFIMTFLILLFVFSIIPAEMYVNVNCICTVLSLLIVILFAPIDNKNKRLSFKKKRKFKKISILFTIVLSVFLWIMFFYNKTISLFIALTMLVVAVLMILGKTKNKMEVNL